MKQEIKEPFGFIYITTNMINGKRYIGQRTFTRGWKTYLGSGIIFKKALLKYGKDSFIKDIISIAYSKEELNDLEKEWIYNYNAVYDENFYNLGYGGEGFSDGNLNPKYGKGDKIKGENNPFYGKHHTKKS